MADQRATLDRQARIIEEQGRTLAALQERVEGANRIRRNDGSLRCPAPTTAAAAVGAQAPGITASAKPHSCRAHAGSACCGRVSRRVPRFDPHSRDRVGLQAGWSGANGRRSHAERPGDRRLVRHLLIPVGVPRAGEEARTVYSPTASRRSTQLRMPSQRGPMRPSSKATSPAAGRSMRLRHAFLQTNHFAVGLTWSTFSDPRADPIGIDFEGLNAISLFRQPLLRWTPSSAGSRYQWALALENPAPDLTGAEGVNFTPDFIARLRWEPDRRREVLEPHGSRAGVAAGQAIARGGVRPVRRRARNGWHRWEHQRRPRAPLEG